MYYVTQNCSFSVTISSSLCETRPVLQFRSSLASLHCMWPSQRKFLGTQCPLLQRNSVVNSQSVHSDVTWHTLHKHILVRDAIVRTKRALLLGCSSVCLSVRLSGTGVHSNHMVHFSADLCLRLDSPLFWAPWHQSMSTYSQLSFSSSTWKRGGIWMRSYRRSIKR